MRLPRPTYLILVAITLSVGVALVLWRTNEDLALEPTDSFVRPLDSSGMCSRDEDCWTDSECELLADVYPPSPEDCLRTNGTRDENCVTKLACNHKSATRYCRRAVGQCDRLGRCVDRGDPRCDGSAAAVCGCDGKTYQCPAEAAYLSTSVARVGACPDTSGRTGP
jgi:hypothetical protein